MIIFNHVSLSHPKQNSSVNHVANPCLRERERMKLLRLLLRTPKQEPRTHRNREARTHSPHSLSHSASHRPRSLSLPWRVWVPVYLVTQCATVFFSVCRAVCQEFYRKVAPLEDPHRTISTKKYVLQAITRTLSLVARRGIVSISFRGFNGGDIT